MSVFFQLFESFSPGSRTSITTTVHGTVLCKWYWWFEEQMCSTIWVKLPDWQVMVVVKDLCRSSRNFWELFQDALGTIAYDITLLG